LFVLLISLFVGLKTMVGIFLDFGNDKGLKSKLVYFNV